MNLANLANCSVTAAKLAALNSAIAIPQSAHQQAARRRATGKTITNHPQTEFDAIDEDLGLMDDLIGQMTKYKLRERLQKRAHHRGHRRQPRQPHTAHAARSTEKLMVVASLYQRHACGHKTAATN